MPLFETVKAPLVRAHFKRDDGVWKLDKMAAIGVSDIPPRQRAFLLTAATEFVGGDKAARPASGLGETPKVAILCDPREEDRPSNDEAVRKFVDAAPRVGLADCMGSI